MQHLLHNPVFNALLSLDAALGQGNERAKFFDEAVSPFAGFDEKNDTGFDELYALVPVGRKILYANPEEIEIPKGWQLSVHIPGLQFVLDRYDPQTEYTANIVPLGQDNVEEMIQLTALTKPGPFDTRTIEFGHYYGIFQNGKLAAMTGQRLHLPGFSEISAVCTHPDHLGKGYAAALLHQQVALILGMGQTPFLHVRADNMRAIELYKRIGFKVSRPMNFYFLRKI